MIKGKVKDKAKPAHKQPRISVNKLAEYLEASSTRRKKIVHDAKYPPKVQVTRYREAREVVKKYLIDKNEDAVLEVIDRMDSTDEFNSDFQEQDTRLSSEVLESLLDCEISSLDGYELTFYDGDNPLLNIKGVDISVNPDLLLHYEFQEQEYVGGIKIHISKGNQLSAESQKIVAVLLHMFIEENETSDELTADSRGCFSFDLFKKSIESCPSAKKHRLAKIETACEEIAMWWDKVEP